MRYRHPQDLGQYAASQIETMPRHEVGGFAYIALVAVFHRLVNAHDCDIEPAEACPLCAELAVALAIIDAYEARIGQRPGVPRQRVRGPRHAI
jgi:hypothetical protein